MKYNFSIGLDLASSSKGKGDQNQINGSSLPSSSSSSTKDQAVKDLTIYIAPVPGQMTPLGTQVSLTQVNILNFDLRCYAKVLKNPNMPYSNFLMSKNPNYHYCRLMKNIGRSTNRWKCSIHSRGHK